MSDLEKRLLEVRDSLDTEEPAVGHMRRFQHRLQKGSGQSRRMNLLHSLQIAASIAVILAAGVVIVRSSKGSSKMAATPAQTEFRETTQFYARQVNQKYTEISGFSFNSEKEKEVLLQELSNMDSYYQDLLKELDANPGDERAMNALIQHYQIKVQVMDQIIAQLMQLKNINTGNNENNSI